MKSNRWLFLLMIAGLVIAGCEGDQGPAGPAGEAGGDLGFSYPGNVETATGAAGENQLVLIKALDPNGRPLIDVSSTLTAADGTFTIGSTLDGTAVPLGLEALAGEALMRAYLVNFEGQTVSPVTEGVVELVSMVVGSPEGRSLMDYTPEEINSLVASAEAALATAGTDLSDPEAVYNQLLADIGGQVADMSGGTFSVGPSGSPVAMDPPDVLTAVDSFEFVMTDGQLEIWDIEDTGAIDDGTDDSYDTMFELSIDGTSFPAQTAPSETAMIEDGREVVLGPVADLAGLTVTRKIYVPGTGSFARFTEILVNESGADITVDVLVDGNLGSDESTDAVHYSSNGNFVADEGDVWMTMKWDSDPTVGFYFPGAVPYKSEDDVEYTWSEVLVPAGGMVTLISWGFQDSNNGPEVMATELALIAADVPPELYTGLTVSEAGANPYVSGGNNVMGEAGAVAPMAEVMAQNQTSGSSRTMTARSDGSFGGYLADTFVGDSIHVTASDGTDEVVTVQ